MKLMYLVNPPYRVYGYGLPRTSGCPSTNRSDSAWLNSLGRQALQGTGWVPPLDVVEDQDNLVVRLELPGLHKDEIDLSLHEGVLTIAGERRPAADANTRTYHLNERFNGQFRRSVALPKAVKTESTKATYEDGILTVVLPKTEAAKPRQIQVSAE
jgi:HSP20 family protein